MKYCFYLLIIVFLFYLSLCEETKNQTETEEKLGKTPEEIKKKREENERKLREQIKRLLKEFGLENAKTITKEQFKNIFVKMLEESIDDEKDSTRLKGFIDLIFYNLISDDMKEIEVDKIMDIFDPENIINALKNLLKTMGLESLLEPISAPLLEAFGGESNKTNDTLNANNTNNKEEKHSDL